MTQRVLSIAKMLVGNTAANPGGGADPPSRRGAYQCWNHDWTIRELQGLDDIDPHPTVDTCARPPGTRGAIRGAKYIDRPEFVRQSIRQPNPPCGRDPAEPDDLDKLRRKASQRASPGCQSLVLGARAVVGRRAHATRIQHA